jgi:ABC-type multidrug transport system fused ATPase/permease subunit
MSEKRASFLGTLPTALRVGRARWFDLGIVVAAGFGLGVVSTAFAVLNSKLFNALDHATKGTGSLQARLRITDPEAFKDISPIVRALLQPVEPSLSNYIWLNLAFLLLIAVINFIATCSRNAIDADLYVLLRQEAFRRCFEEDRSAVLLEAEAQAIGGTDTSNRLSSALNRGANGVASLYSLFINLAQQITTLAVAIVSAGTKYWPITAACGGVIAVQLFISLWQARQLQKGRVETDAEINRLHGKTANWLDNRELILIFDKGHKYQELLHDLTKKLTEKRKNIFNIEEFTTQLQRFTRDSGQIIVVLFAATAAIAILKGTRIGSESIVFFAVSLYGSLLSSARSLISNFDSFRRTTAMSTSYLRIIADEDRAAPTETEWRKGRDVVLEAVTCGYANGKTPLRDFSLTIPAGRTTLILGPSGCGKTTIGKMILGLTPATVGCVRVGGADVTAWPRGLLRAQMSYSPQQDHVLDETVENNLRLAESDREFTTDELVDVLKETGLAGVSLADNAQQLSGGQMQRVAAARILLDTAEIMVLDEPMAGVDLYTMAAIAPLLEQHWAVRNQTVVVISHKLIFTGFADHIVLLNENGKVVAQGPPQELVQTSNEFAKLLGAAINQAGGGYRERMAPKQS